MQPVLNLLNVSMDSSDLSSGIALDGAEMTDARGAFNFAAVLQKNVGGEQAVGEQLPGRGNFLPVLTLEQQSATHLAGSVEDADVGQVGAIAALNRRLDSGPSATILDLLSVDELSAGVSLGASLIPNQAVSQQDGSAARLPSSLMPVIDNAGSGPKLEAPLLPTMPTLLNGAGDESRSQLNSLAAIPQLPEASGTLRALDQNAARGGLAPPKVASPGVSTVASDLTATLDGQAELDLAFERMSQQVVNATRPGIETALDGNNRLLSLGNNGHLQAAGTPGLLGASSANDRSGLPLIDSASSSISTPVRDSAWGDRISQHVMTMAANKTRTAELRLTPAELGPLRVQIDIEDGKANVAFQSQHAVTRDALEVALPRLREMLAENGLSLGQANIGEREQTQREQDGNAAAEAEFGASEEQDSDTQAGRTQVAHESRGRGLVDAFV